VNLLPILSHPQDAVGLSPRLNPRWELQPQLKLSAGFPCPEKLQVKVGFEVEKQGHLKPETLWVLALAPHMQSPLGTLRLEAERSPDGEIRLKGKQ
jgi:hypothetical protein